MRFEPPARDLPDSLTWVLTRAFGPVRRVTGVAVERVVEAVDLARGLGLGARIVTRCGPELLRQEVGAGPAGILVRDRALVLAQELRLLETLERVQAVAAQIGAATIPLKGMALLIRGVSASGSRPMADVDLLVEEDRVDHLQNALIAAGFVAPDGRSYEHQAPMLRDPYGLAVELHRFVPGVRAAGSGRSARREAFESAGVFGLAAHALVHALAQHGFTPSASGLVWIGDLIDLGYGDRATSVDDLLAWIGDVPPADEIAAALDLTKVLAEGKLGALGTTGPSRTLLQHFVFGSIDPDYRAALRLRSFDQPLSERPSGARFRALRSTLFPPRRRSTVTGIESWAAYSLRVLQRPGYLFRRWREARRGVRLE